MRTAYIGMGANLASWAGAPETTLAAAALRLESLGRVVCRSSLYSTAPVGFAAQPRFMNAVVALTTELAPRELLDGLLAIEQEFGRDRAAGFANGPRTLDLDILLFGKLKISEPGLEIPHPRLAERAFVLAPLNEIAPKAVVPGAAKTIGQLLARLIEATKAVSDAVIRIKSKTGADGEIVSEAFKGGRAAQVPGEVSTTTEDGCPRCLAFGHLGDHEPQPALPKAAGPTAGGCR